ncbi:MAG: Creatinine amidohydrolase [Nocardioidaceae bacterium]|nr:Creatinine amidohydrolase [Nocardioidaceae bacterium]
MNLADLTWPTVPDDVLVLVPVGSVEQHGPHLPLDTDTVIAVAVAEGVAADRRGTVVAPPIAYGSSGEHQAFAGTSSIGTDALVATLVELTRSMATWATRIVFVNGHGGNLAALNAAVAQLTDEGHQVAWVPCATEEVDLHAGLTETSLMLHLRPASVRTDHLVAGNTASLSTILPEMMAGGVVAVSANGVLGDPRGATAEHGAAVLASMVADAAVRIAFAATGGPR